MKTLILIAGSFLLCAACTTDTEGPLADPYAFHIPDNFPSVQYTFENNPISKEGFELGRHLFYDPSLSLDNSISCASCHQQAVAFADPVHRLSKGVNDVSGFRNAPPIQNMAFQKHFFWDGGVKHLDFVPVNAITSELEMNETVEAVIQKLERSQRYPQRFQNAFGTPEISSQRIFYALSQFMALMISSNSRYDLHSRGEAVSLSQGELEGLTLFRNHCSACHAGELFTDGSFRNNGLDKQHDKDPGREIITEFSGDRGKFKVPSLRNVALTSPYMHDGRFATLEEVLQHYVHDIQPSETLDPALRESTGGLNLSEEESHKIILFLNTLTDQSFTQDKRFSFPIKP